MKFWDWIGRKNKWGHGTFPPKNGRIDDTDKIISTREIKLPSGRKLYVTHVETDLPVEWLYEKQR